MGHEVRSEGILHDFPNSASRPVRAAHEPNCGLLLTAINQKKPLATAAYTTATMTDPPEFRKSTNACSFAEDLRG